MLRVSRLKRLPRQLLLLLLLLLLMLMLMLLLIRTRTPRRYTTAKRRAWGFSARSKCSSPPPPPPRMLSYNVDTTKHKTLPLSYCFFLNVFDVLPSPTRFFKLFVNQSQAHICLDAAAHQLGVERRRIYDIVNILESVDVVTRKGKNQYMWHGFGQLNAALGQLQVTWRACLIIETMYIIQRASKAFISLHN